MYQCTNFHKYFSFREELVLRARQWPWCFLTQEENHTCSTLWTLQVNIPWHTSHNAALVTISPWDKKGLVLQKHTHCLMFFLFSFLPRSCEFLWWGHSRDPNLRRNCAIYRCCRRGENFFGYCCVSPISQLSSCLLVCPVIKSRAAPVHQPMSVWHIVLTQITICGSLSINTSL